MLIFSNKKLAILLLFYCGIFTSCISAPTQEPTLTASFETTDLKATKNPKPSSIPAQTQIDEVEPTPVLTKTASVIEEIEVITPTKEIVVSNLPFPEIPGWIGFVDWYSDGIDIINASGQGWRRIIDQDSFFGSPAWSPDGQWIAYEYTASDTGMDIFIARPDGSEKVNITGFPGHESSPSWSLDGKNIIFTHMIGETVDVISDIFSINIETRVVHQLTETPEEIEHFPTFSPDGNFIAFLLWIEDDQPHNYYLMTMNNDGSEIKRIVDMPVGIGKIAWSPDGGKIAFRSFEKCGDIYIVNVDGSDLVQLTKGPGREKNPTWSPDGKYIAYNATESCEEGSEGVAIGWQIFIISSDGTQMRQLTDKVKAYPLDPAWHPLPGLEIDKKYTITESGDFLNLRSEPSVNGEILTKMREGEEILVLNGPVEADEYLWWYVRVSSEDLQGWVAENPGWFAGEW